MDTSKPVAHMLGAITGDIIGSIYEHANIFTEDFPLFHKACFMTDDGVLTCAVAQAMLNSRANDTYLYDELVSSLQGFGRRYPDAGYGLRFIEWIWSDDPKPYNSWGNGAPMRCSPAGWLCADPVSAYEVGEQTALPTHDHPHAKKAAGVTAALICMARNGESKADLKTYALSQYSIPSLDYLRRHYEYTESSSGTMPAALSCFFNSNSFEDCIRKAISIGGDSDTIAAITGSIAEAYYGIPEDIRNKAWEYVPEELRLVLHNFHDTFIHD